MKVVKKLVAVLLLPCFAMASEYPSKPIKIVVAFAAGSTTDIVARSIGQNLSVALGQPVIVENRPGAGGNIATVLPLTEN